MYAMIKTGGKQIKVEVGQEIYVEKLDVQADEVVTFNEVLLIGGESTIVGSRGRNTALSFRRIPFGGWSSRPGPPTSSSSAASSKTRGPRLSPRSREPTAACFGSRRMASGWNLGAR